MSPLNRSVLICAGALALASSCMSETGNGVITTQERLVPAFSKVEVQDAIQVSISRGPTRVTISTDENLTSFYEIDVDGETLKIKEMSNFKLRPTGAVFVDIQTERMERLEVRNGAQVSADATQAGEFRLIVKDRSSATVSRIQTSELILEATDESRVDVFGEATQLRVESRSQSAVNADGLDAQTVKVVATRQSLVNVNAQRSIEVDASGDSVVTVSGNPLDRNIDADSGSQVSFINE
ncbi:MAG: DUF2807 domain-containing protein [Archangium sp.]|nr:DUF2807 domain-containing protein [Archangium sp.]